MHHMMAIDVIRRLPFNGLSRSFISFSSDTQIEINSGDLIRKLNITDIPGKQLKVRAGRAHLKQYEGSFQVS